MKDFTIVTACTPKYLTKLKWTISTWNLKPQFRGKKLILFHHGFNNLSDLDFVKDYFDVEFIHWDMPEYDGDRELMLSAFILGAAKYIKTPYFVKIDVDAFFIKPDDVFEDKDFEYDVVGHRWRYTKPGTWINILDKYHLGKDTGDYGRKYVKKRLASFGCLHKTEFIQMLSKKFGDRLPIPSHDTIVWYFAEHMLDRKWKSKSLKRRGFTNSSKLRKIKLQVCDAVISNQEFFKDNTPDYIQKEVISRQNNYVPLTLPKLSIEICFFCHNFQRRLNWVLSSIVEQVGDVPDIIVNIASLENDGVPTTEDLVNYYSKNYGLVFNPIIFKEKDQINYRGIIRNIQIEKSKGDWLHFADADHLFHPKFFSELGKVIKTGEKDKGIITSINKITTDIESTNKIFEDKDKAYYQKNVFEVSSKIKMIKHRVLIVAGGNMQIVSRKTINEKNNGIYVDPNNNRDRGYFSSKGGTARSDRQFRRNINRQHILKLPQVINLNHYRDKESGRHLEEQR